MKVYRNHPIGVEDSFKLRNTSQLLRSIVLLLVVRRGHERNIHALDCQQLQLSAVVESWGIELALVIIRVTWNSAPYLRHVLSNVGTIKFPSEMLKRKKQKILGCARFYLCVLGRIVQVSKKCTVSYLTKMIILTIFDISTVEFIATSQLPNGQ